MNIWHFSGKPLRRKRLEFVQTSSAVACKNRKEKPGRFDKINSSPAWVCVFESHLLIDVIQFSAFFFFFFLFGDFFSPHWRETESRVCYFIAKGSNCLYSVILWCSDIVLLNLGGEITNRWDWEFFSFCAEARHFYPGCKHSASYSRLLQWL